MSLVRERDASERMETLLGLFVSPPITCQGGFAVCFGLCYVLHCCWCCAAGNFRVVEEWYVRVWLPVALSPTYAEVFERPSFTRLARLLLPAHSPACHSSASQKVTVPSPAGEWSIAPPSPPPSSSSPPPPPAAAAAAGGFRVGRGQGVGLRIADLIQVDLGISRSGMKQVRPPPGLIGRLQNRLSHLCMLCLIFCFSFSLPFLRPFSFFALADSEAKRRMMWSSWCVRTVPGGCARSFFDRRKRRCFGAPLSRPSTTPIVTCLVGANNA